MTAVWKNTARKRRVLVLALGTLALVACADQTALAPTSETPEFGVSPYANGLATTGWQAQTRLLVAANNVNPVAATRVYATVAVAQYGAIDNTDDQGYADGTLPDEGYGAGGRARLEAERGAVAGASLAVLGFFFPGAKPALEQRVQNETTGHPQFDRGLAIGTQFGEKMVEWARNDRTADPWPGTVPVGPGMWRNNGPPASPMQGKAKPYFLTSGDQFRSASPPAFGSPAFLADLDEIRVLSATRTPAQLATALFWNLGTGTISASGYWNQLASSYIEQDRLDERAAAHLFALMHAAQFDAIVGCWDAKYFYWYIRPSQAEPAITLPLGLPNHPSYPSGHSCNSASAATVLAHRFPAHSTELAGFVAEAGLSRMYGGIHYRFDIAAGQKLGADVARHAIAFDQSHGLLSSVR